jgi:hypothetical protein
MHSLFYLKFTLRMKTTVLKILKIKTSANQSAGARSELGVELDNMLPALIL